MLDATKERALGALARLTRSQYAFRIRFAVSPRSGLTDPAERIVLWRRGRRVVLLESATRDEPLESSREWVVKGWGYLDEHAAAEAGVQWRSILETAFAKVRLAADFGDRTPGGGRLTSAGTEWLRHQFGVPSRTPILNDRYGLGTFRRYPSPRFARLGPVSVTVTRSVADLQRAVYLALESAGPERQERDHIAYDLFSASFFTRDPDARFVLLVMACETLMEPADRGADIRQHVDSLIRHTEEAGLSRADADSILGSLRWLYKESIGQAGRRLASRLEPRRYMDEAPAKFFTQCYTMRSALVHGHTTRPSAADVGLRAASLEVFVSDLLSGPLLQLDL